MPIIEWSNDFKININEFDEHHKELVRIINRLYDTRKADNPHKETESILNSLSVYSTIHFAREEELMKKYAYEDFNSHKRKHVELRDKQKGISKLCSMVSVDLENSLKDTLSKWLEHHLKGDDKKLGEYLNSKGVH